MKLGQLIGIFIILALLLLGATYIVAQQKETRLPSSLAGIGTLDNDPDRDDSTIVTTEVIHIVDYTDEGFSLDTLFLRAGESIRFENKTDALMWVTHEGSIGCMEGVDEFDQCAPSDTFEYKFEDVGEWKFYNHLNQEHRGTILVQ